MATRPITEPTERSIPPVMMTGVMPSAMTPMKAKLRVMFEEIVLGGKRSGLAIAHDAANHDKDDRYQKDCAASSACRPRLPPIGTRPRSPR